MSHDSTQSAKIQIDDPEAGSTWIASIVGITILGVLVIAVCVFYFRFEEEEVDVKVILPASTWTVALKTAQLSQLSVYQKYSVTAPDGSEESRIRIPVAQAMEFVIADSKNPPKVAPPTPPAVLAPASAPAPATPTGAIVK